MTCKHCGKPGKACCQLCAKLNRVTIEVQPPDRRLLCASWGVEDITKVVSYLVNREIRTLKVVIDDDT